MWTLQIAGGGGVCDLKVIGHQLHHLFPPRSIPLVSGNVAKEHLRNMGLIPV
jgi:hypothetical protein